MKVLGTIKNYCLYCGIEKEEYNKIKKSAYVSNFNVWRLIHILMTAVFSFLFIYSLVSDLLKPNLFFYMSAMVYSLLVTCLFLFVLKKDSIVSQFIIYLSISMLFLFGCLISSNKPDMPSTTFIAILLITPIFMIDKPYFMAIELIVASAVYFVWMYFVKDPNIWQIDIVNTSIFLVVSIFLHIISNSVRIKEFVLTRKIDIQKDTDGMTGLKNKSALTREINEFIEDKTKNKAIMMLIDIDKFKDINDTFGHDVGDIVLIQLAEFLSKKFVNGEVVGRWGGDEFIIFIKDEDDTEYARKVATQIVKGSANYISFPKQNGPISVSVGIAIYRGLANNYSDIFKKADIAMYKAKAHNGDNFAFFEEK